MKMSKHLEKRRFISCFEEHGKLFDGGLTISEDFNQCPLIEATNIDDYFGNVINFVDWFYQGCGDAGKIMSKLQHRWNRINQIRDEIQARDTNQYIDIQHIAQYIDIANINIDFQKISMKISILKSRTNQYQY